MMLLRGAALIVILLAGCKMPALPSLTPYKMDVQQGNVVTQEMMSKLKPGMTPGQVRFILGTPLVIDAFHKDRWDYVYRFEKGGTLVEHRRIVIVFKDDKLARIEGDVVGEGKGATGGGVKIDKPAPAPAKAAGAPPASPKPQPAVAPPAGATLTTTSGEPVTAGGASTDAPGGAMRSKDQKPAEEKATAGKPTEEKPNEERGFFGRMLERLGF